MVRRLEQLLVDEGLRVEAVRAVLSQRGNNPALAAVSARNAHVQLQQGEGALLQRVLAAMARPVRIMRGKDVDQHAKVCGGGGETNMGYGRGTWVRSGRERMVLV